ncbi:hypothetical protein DERF_013491 [Dermatophagoides farinae]|uniref:Uncharacterized protein n=1 Tax=Dermatophagoides farinae TaxID=6954 RepID=A0A922KYN1_DERFA|nr:hypothetical protein DERF_013491 [Dermatophagoides farinae]
MRKNKKSNDRIEEDDRMIFKIIESKHLYMTSYDVICLYEIMMNEKKNLVHTAIGSCKIEHHHHHRCPRWFIELMLAHSTHLIAEILGNRYDCDMMVIG